MIKKIFNISLNKQLTNLITYGVGQGFNLITPLLVVPYIISKCGVENYGKTSIGMAISFFLMVFIDYGSDIAGVKEIAINRENEVLLEKIFITNIASKFILLLITLIFATFIFLFIPFFNSEKEMFFLGFPILIAQSINPTWFLQGVEDFKKITILNILSKLIYLFCIFLFIKKEVDYVLINLFWGMGTLLANAGAFFYLFKKKSFSFKNTSKQEVIFFLKSNFSIFYSQVFVSLQMYSPIMLIGFFLNNLMAGQYKIVEQIIVVFKTYIYLFFNFVYPRVCFLIESNLKKGILFWKTYNGLNFIFIVLSMFFLNVFSKNAVSYFTKNEVTEISGFLKIATAIPALLALTIPLKQLVLGFNHQKFYIKTTMIMVIINLLMIMIIIPIYATQGVFISLIITEILTLSIYYFNIKEKVDFKNFF